MSRSAIVFGGAGFIGTHLLIGLQQRGFEKLISVDMCDPKEKVLSVVYINADVRDLSNFRSDFPIEVIYNLAAVHATPGHPDHEYYETNISGATQITAFARRSGVKKIIFTSSISVYGAGEETKSEATAPSPRSSYGWSKLLAEGIHRAWFDESPENRLVVVRPAVIFGPGEGGNFTRMARLLKKGFFIYPGRKNTLKACFYVKDLIEAIFFAEQQADRFVLFNGCYGDRYSLEQIVETFRQNHFPKVKTILLPLWVVRAAALALRPLSPLNLGIHPDRVMKLVRSTDILPAWLEQRDYPSRGKLPAALNHWENATNGAFD